MNINNDSLDCDHEECEEELKVLHLTRDEVLYIDDRLTMMIEKDGREGSFTTVIPIMANAGLPAPVDLLDKVGMAVLEVTDDIEMKTTVPIAVTATDLYMLREIAKSSIKLNGKYVGLSLKKKIYSLLFEEEHKENITFRRLVSDIDLDLDTEPSKLDWSGESG